MKRLLVVVLLAFGCAASNCSQPSPIPTPTPTAATACDNLARLGCADGTAPNCVQILQQIIDQHMTRTPVNLSCLTSAATLDAAIGCGAVVCK